MRDLVNVPAAGQPRHAKPLSGLNAVTEAWAVISTHFKGRWASSKMLLFAYYASNEGTDPNVHGFAPYLSASASSSHHQHCQRSLHPCLPLSRLSITACPVACPLPSHRGGSGGRQLKGGAGAGAANPFSSPGFSVPDLLGAMTGFLRDGGGAVPYDQDS